MIVETRFRDIPFEELLKCMPNSDTPRNRDNWEKRMRGRPILIETPAVDAMLASQQFETFQCGGPFYLDLTHKVKHAAVCVHVAEIGD